MLSLKFKILIFWGLYLFIIKTFRFIIFLNNSFLRGKLISNLKFPTKMDKKKDYNPEEEVVGDYKPLVNLPEVELRTGEEEEAIVVNIRTKLYRWDDS